MNTRMKALRGKKIDYKFKKNNQLINILIKSINSYKIKIVNLIILIN